VLETIVESEHVQEDGTVKFVTTVEKSDSFFHFFNPPPYVESANISDALVFTVDVEVLISLTHPLRHHLRTHPYYKRVLIYVVLILQLAKYIREKIVGKAILYYTGEATLGVTHTYSEISDTNTEDSQEEDIEMEELLGDV